MQPFKLFITVHNLFTSSRRDTRWTYLVACCSLYYSPLDQDEAEHEKHANMLDRTEIPRLNKATETMQTCCLVPGTSSGRIELGFDALQMFCTQAFVLFV